MGAIAAERGVPLAVWDMSLLERVEYFWLQLVATPNSGAAYAAYARAAAVAGFSYTTDGFDNLGAAGWRDRASEEERAVLLTGAHQPA